MGAFGTGYTNYQINQTTSAYSNYTIFFQGPADQTELAWGSGVQQFTKDMERAKLRAENKDTFRTWAGAKNGRPFHLRKWYR